MKVTSTLSITSETNDYDNYRLFLLPFRMYHKMRFKSIRYVTVDFDHLEYT